LNTPSGTPANEPLRSAPATKSILKGREKGERSSGQMDPDGWVPRGMLGKLTPVQVPAKIEAPRVDEEDVIEVPPSLVRPEGTLPGQLGEEDKSGELQVVPLPERRKVEDAASSVEAPAIEARGPLPNREDIPVRRPQIQGLQRPTASSDGAGGVPNLADPRKIIDQGESGTRSSRQLQEEIERFESDSGAIDSATPNDEYDRPSDEARLNEELPEETNPVRERLQREGKQPPLEAPAPVISAAALRLQQPIARILQYHYARPENARERTPWGMLHAILPYGVDAKISTGSKRFNAIAWMAGNNPSRNLKMLTVGRDGRIAAKIGVGLQGHQAQMLAIYAQSGVPFDYPLIVNGKRFTLADLAQTEMLACKSGQELTFTLIGLSHYMPTDSQWRSADGQLWNFERLIREELAQPIVGAACGGTHRLMGFSYALKQRRLEGLPINGQWARAEIFINDFVQYAWQLQNRDGSFSTDWFEGPADNGNLDRKIQTSGHILEWLVFNASEDELQDERVIRGITFLTNAMGSNLSNDWEVGPKGHALRALSLYHRRMFSSGRPWIPANQPTSEARTTNARRR
jgi:hypothetical protein